MSCKSNALNKYILNASKVIGKHAGLSTAEILRDAIDTSIRLNKPNFLNQLIADGTLDAALEEKGNEDLFENLIEYADERTQFYKDKINATTSESSEVVSSEGKRSVPEILEDIQREHIASAITNTESEDTYNRDYRNTALNELPSPIDEKGEDAHMRNFLNMYFKGKSAYFNEFYESVHSNFRQVLTGTKLESGQQTIAELEGPIHNLSPRFKTLIEQWTELSSVVETKTMQEINDAFIRSDNASLELRQAYYAYLVVHNTNLIMSYMVDGASIQRDGKKDDYYSVNEYDIKTEAYAASEFERYINQTSKKIKFDVTEDTAKDILKLKKIETFTSLTDASQEFSIGRYLVISGIENNDLLTTAEFTDKFLQGAGMPFIDDNSNSLAYIKNDDVFEIVPAGLIRVSKPHILTFNIADSHKIGHEEDFNGYDNDTAFVKFLVKSTPRLLNVEMKGPRGKGKMNLIQDRHAPYMSESEYYTISTEISGLADRTYPGIKRYLERRLNENVYSDASDIIIVRSLYYAYFHDNVYEYTPVVGQQKVRMAPLMGLASTKQISFDVDKMNLADRMMNTMIQFFSKQSVGRMFYKENKLVKLLAAETDPLEIVLPNAINSNVFITPGIAHESVGNRITVQGGNQKVEVFYKLPYSKGSLKVIIENTGNGVQVNLSDDSQAKLQDEYAPEILSAFFTSLRLPSKFYDKRFTERLANDKHNMGIFVSNLLAYVGLNITSNNEVLMRQSDGAVKKIATYYNETSIDTVVKVPIKAIATLWGSINGSLSAGYEINGEGNSTARVTNIDREGRLQEHIDRAANKYLDFGIEHNNSNNLFNYTLINNEDNPVIGKVIRRLQKDGISKNLNFFSNIDMTLQQRITHLIEGAFLTNLALAKDTETMEFITQAMVYSDRGRIYMYNVELKQDPKSPGAKRVFRENYIETYRGKYASMQTDTLHSWADFLLSPDLARWGNLSFENLHTAKAIGYEMLNHSAHDLNSGDVISTYINRVAKLGISIEAAGKSSQLTRNTHVYNHNGIATLEATGGVMTAFMNDPKKAEAFAKMNVKQTKEVLADDEFGFTDYTSPQARKAAEKVFGDNVTFDDVIEMHHYITAPFGDSVLDTLMTPDTEFGKNKLMAKIAMEKGRVLTMDDYLPFMQERTSNYIKQSKRVQSQNSVGTRARTLNGYGHFAQSLPKNDLIKGISSRQIALVKDAPQEYKFEAGIQVGIFTELHGIRTSNKNAMITFGSASLEVKLELGRFIMADLNNEIYINNIEEIDSLLEIMSAELGIAYIPVLDTTNANSVEGYIDVSNPLKGKTKISIVQETHTALNVQIIQDKLNNDEGEIGLGLGRTSKGILIDEDLVKGYLNLLGINGLIDTQDSFDGVHWGHPLYFIKLSASLGNQFSSFSTDGSAVKSLTQHRNSHKNRLIIQKESTQNMFSNEILRTVGNAKLHNAFKIMNESQIFANKISLQFTEEGTGRRYAKSFDSTEDVETYVRELLQTDNEEEVAKMLEDVLPDFGVYKTLPINGALVKVPAVDDNGNIVPEGKAIMQSFNNLQELWEYFDSYFNEDSWLRVAEVLADNPLIRDSYVEKLGFTSGQKSGVSGMNNADLLRNSTTKADQLVFNDVSNDNHIVMLQKLHGTETSEAVGHASKIAITSQFISAMLFEGRTPTQAMNVTAGQAMLTNSKRMTFFRNLRKEIVENKAIFDEYDEPKIDGNRRFSEFQEGEIDNNLIEKFEDSLNANSAFKKVLFTRISLKWIVDNLKVDRHSPAVIKMVRDFKAGKTFNSHMMRELAVTAVRSEVHTKNIKLTLPGAIAVTSPADFMMSMHSIDGKRMPRSRAIEYILQQNKDINTITVTGEKSVAAGILPTDMVLAKIGKETALLPYAKAVKQGAEEITFAVLPEKNSKMTGWSATQEYVSPQDFEDLENTPAIMLKLRVEPQDIADPAQAADANSRTFNNKINYVKYRKQSSKDILRGSEDDMIEFNKYIQNKDIITDLKGVFERDTDYIDVGTFDEFMRFTKEIFPLSDISTPMYGAITLGAGEPMIVTNKRSVLGGTHVMFNNVGAKSVFEKYNPVLDVADYENASVTQLLEVGFTYAQISEYLRSNNMSINKTFFDEGINSLQLNLPAGNIQYIVFSDNNTEFKSNDIVDLSDIETVEKFEDWKKTKKKDKIKAKLMGDMFFDEEINAPNAEDFVRNKNTGDVYMQFYAQKLHEYNMGDDFDAYEVYTDTDQDLNWSKYFVMGEDGKRIPLENFSVMQKEYIFNKNLDLYNAIYEESEGKKITKSNKKQIGERLKAELRIFIEENDVVIQEAEVFAPNFNMKAFMMQEGETIESIIGFSGDYKTELTHAESVFTDKLNSRNKGVIKLEVPFDVEETEVMINDYRFKAATTTDENKKETFRLIADELATILKLFDTIDTAKQQGMVIDESIILNNAMDDIRTRIVSLNNIQLRNDVKKIAETFMNALYIIPPRIPGQGKQSGYVARIKAFIESNKNALYSPREAYVVTGKDNDIDTDNVITRAINKFGMQYEYSKYLLTEDGKVPENPTMVDPTSAPIMNAKGHNPVLQEELINISAEITKELEELGYDEDVINAKINNTINKHVAAFEKGVQNYIIDSMRYIMTHKNNIVENETPISMEALNDIVKKIEDGIDKSFYNKDIHAMNSFNSAWIPILEHLNMQGKTAIADFANGQRTLAAVLMVQYSLPDQVLRVGRGSSSTSITRSVIEANKDHLTHLNDDGTMPAEVGLAITISDARGKKVVKLRDTFAGLEDHNKMKQLDIIRDPNTSKLGKTQAWEMLSQLLSAATDNAKALILGKIGASNDTNTLYATMLILGYELEDIQKFLLHPDLADIFKRLRDARNAFDGVSLKSILKKKKNKNIAEEELLDIINASDGLNDFRRILTLAQNNRIETYDIYKVLNPINREKSNLTVNDLFNGTSKLADSEFIPGTKGSPVNALFYIKNHLHAKALLQSAALTENIVTAVSDVDRLLSDKIKTVSKESDYFMNKDSYQQTGIFLDEVLILDYINDKSVQLPLGENRVAKYDLSNQDQKDDFIYKIHESFSYIEERYNNIIGTKNAFFEALTKQKSRYNRNKTILNIPFLSEAPPAIKSALDQALAELTEVSNDRLKVELEALKDALFYYTLITSRGKASRNAIISLFEDRYIEFSNAVTDTKIMNEGSAVRSLVMFSEKDQEANDNNKMFLQLLTPASAPAIQLNTDKISVIPDAMIDEVTGIAFEDFMGEAEHGLDEIDFLDDFKFLNKGGKMSIKIDPKLNNIIGVPKTHTIFRVKHPDLINSMYTKATINEKYNNVPIKLFRRNSAESIPFNMAYPSEGEYSTLNGVSKELQQNIFRAGYDIGMRVILHEDINTEQQTNGRVLAYLGDGEYLIIDDNKTLTTIADTTLEEFNPDKIFYGNNFDYAPAYLVNDYSIRSYQLAKEETVWVVRGKEILLQDNIVRIKKKNNTYNSTVTQDNAEDIVSYVFEHLDESLHPQHEIKSLENIVKAKDTHYSELLEETTLHKDFLIEAYRLYREAYSNHINMEPGSVINILEKLGNTFENYNIISRDKYLNKSFDSSWVEVTGVKTIYMEDLIDQYNFSFNNNLNKKAVAKNFTNILLHERSRAINADPAADTLDRIREQAQRLFPKGMKFNKNLFTFIGDNIESKFINNKNCPS